MNPVEFQATGIDLYSGAGGATEGLRQAGVRVLLAVENDSLAVETYAMNHPDPRVLRQDIRTCDPNKIREELGLSKGELTIIKACPPCQSFSSLSNSTEATETGDKLVLEIVRWVDAFRPQSFAIENVPGLRRAASYKRLLAAMRRRGYSCRDFDVFASDFGVPQRRRRLLVAGIRTDCVPRVPHDLAQPTSNEQPSAAEAIASLPPVGTSDDPLHVFRNLSPLVQMRVESIPANGSRFDLPPELQLACHAGLGTRSATSSYGRVPTSGPAPTMTTRCTTPSCGRFLHPTEARGLSLREAAIIQSFPENYRFAGGYDARERQIGNAVPVQMVRVFVARILALLNPNAAWDGCSLGVPA